jgi:hypothetical protein
MLLDALRPATKDQGCLGGGGAGLLISGLQVPEVVQGASWVMLNGLLIRKGVFLGLDPFD